ncbi:hypothetical protein, partial [Roseburia faecis]|uniref:hypothetical protein n=1 Tax=Roseburia faecis TaxID=301302 RepID=UPI001A9B1655
EMESSFCVRSRMVSLTQSGAGTVGFIENEWVKVEQKAFDIDRYIRRMQRESEILKIVQKLVIESGE